MVVIWKVFVGFGDLVIEYGRLLFFFIRLFKVFLGIFMGYYCGFKVIDKLFVRGE